MDRISSPAYLEIKTDTCMCSLLQLHPVENQETLWLFLILRKEVLLTGKTFKHPVKICFHCVASQTQVKQRELVRDCAFFFFAQKQLEIKSPVY